MGRVTPRDITSHIRDHSVECGPLIAKAMLTGGKLTKILSSFWDRFVIELKDDPSSRF